MLKLAVQRRIFSIVIKTFVRRILKSQLEGWCLSLVRLSASHCFTFPEAIQARNPAAATELTFRIYNIQGSPVCQLNLSRQSVGDHLVRATAAHWTGRNDLREAVLSGVHYYRLKAGQYQSTQRNVGTEVDRKAQC